MNESASQRENARWIAALEELIKAGFVMQADKKLQIFHKFIGIKTDRFSTYALVYNEKASVTLHDDSSSGSSDPTPDGSKVNSSESSDI